jgi:hypothetical protein
MNRLTRLETRSLRENGEASSAYPVIKSKAHTSDLLGGFSLIYLSILRYWLNRIKPWPDMKSFLCPVDMAEPQNAGG